MERGQFTFYKSFYDAISHLDDAADKLALYEALCSYALTGAEPDLSDASGTVKAIFCLIVPTLDSSRKKAESGREGGIAESKPEANAKQSASKAEANRKQTQSKPEANAKQSASKKEIEIEYKRELEGKVEIEGEKEIDRGYGGKEEETPDGADALPPVLRTALDDWLAYKRERREPYKPKGLHALISQIERACALHSPEVVADLIHDCMASGYRGITFDRLERRGGRARAAPESGNPFLDMLRGDAP